MAQALPSSESTCGEALAPASALAASSHVMATSTRRSGISGMRSTLIASHGRVLGSFAAISSHSA